MRASFISIGDTNYNYSEKPFLLNYNNDNIKSETTVDQNGNNQNLKIKITTTSWWFDFVTSKRGFILITPDNM